MEDPAMIRELNAYDQFFDPKETHAYLRGELDCMDQDQSEENRFAKGREQATEQHTLACIKEGIPAEKVFRMFNMSSREISNFLNKYKDLPNWTGDITLMSAEKKSDEQIKAERYLELRLSIERIYDELVLKNRFAEDLDVKYEYAVKRALAEGAECGKNEATEQNALTFIKAGFSKDKIFKILNMSEEKIAAFLNKYKDL